MRATLRAAAVAAASILHLAKGFVPATPLLRSQGTAGPALRRNACGARMMAEGGATFGELDGSAVRVGIIKSRWNEGTIKNLAEGVRSALKDCNVKDENIFETEVPGSFELPLAARFLALSQTVDSIVCLGCLIKGETMHFEYIAGAASKGLMDVSLQTSTPVVFGVLTVLDEAQAASRSTGANNHGVDWGKTAVEMGLLRLSALGQAKGPAAMGFGKADGVAGDGDKKGPGMPGRKIGF